MNTINFNGNLNKQEAFSLTTNRAFLYADALFDTLLVKHLTPIFMEAHYFRLLASMRELRMEIPTFFTQEYLQGEIIKTVEANGLSSARVRTTIYRDTKGLYTPLTQQVSFVIQITELVAYKPKNNYVLGIYKENLLNTTSLNNLKTTNRIHNVLASIFAVENEFDNCVLLNHKHQVAEVINANIFAVFEHEIKTPALSEGCVNGIIRQKVIALLEKHPQYQIRETVLTPYELQKADEIFITNSVIGVQSISQYKRKSYTLSVGKQLLQELYSKP